MTLVFPFNTFVPLIIHTKPTPMRIKNLHPALYVVLSCLISATLFAQTWTMKAPPGGKVRGAIGFSIGTKGYIGTGDRGGAFATSDFWEWTQATNVWTQKANVGTAYWLGVGFSIGTKGYAGAGDGGGFTGTQTFWEYDQGTNAWTQRANVGGAIREQAVGFSIGNFGYIGTGTDKYVCPANGNASYKDFWQWNQSNNTWTQMANLPGNARFGATGFSIGTKGYILEGTDPSAVYYQDLWEWDQPTNTWTQKANCPGTGRSHGVSFSIGAKGYMGTGVDKAGNNLNDFWRWDQATNTWKQMTNFGGTPRYIAVGFSIGQYGYVGTGDSGPVCNDAQKVEENDFWEFKDSACTVTGSVVSDPATTICMGDPVHLTATGGGTYAWNTGQVTSAINVAPNFTTTYSCVVTSTSGCSGTFVHTILVDTSCGSATGTPSIHQQAFHASVTPNPFAESAALIVTGIEAGESYEVKIFDLLGNQVRAVNFSGKRNIIEKEGLKDGVYFYKITFNNSSGRNSVTGKIIVSGR